MTTRTALPLLLTLTYRVFFRGNFYDAIEERPVLRRRWGIGCVGLASACDSR